MSVRNRLSRAYAILERLSPFVSRLTGVVFLTESITGWFGLSVIAANPDVFFFIFGIVLWANGGESRASQKEVGRLERKLEYREEELEQYRQFSDSD